MVKKLKSTTEGFLKKYNIKKSWVVIGVVAIIVLVLILAGDSSTITTVPTE
jgi:uncharacterized integral membrane protein